MTSRCKSCDKVLDEYEMSHKDTNNQYTELCFYCIHKAEDLLETWEPPTGNFFTEGRRTCKHE